MNRILILSHGESDLSALILRHCTGATFVPFLRFDEVDTDAFDAVAVLGGNGACAYTFPPVQRQRIEAMREESMRYLQNALSLCQRA
jgi:hypothetical protein